MKKVFMKSDQFWPDCDRRASRSKDLWTEHVLLFVFHHIFPHNSLTKIKQEHNIYKLFDQD